MDKTSQFVLIAQRILREFRALSETVRTGFLGIQKQVETVAKDQNAKNQREQSPPVLRAELQIPEAIEHRKEAENRKKVHREWYALILNLLTLAAVVVYAGINYHMLCQMKKTVKSAEDANNIARDALTANQRAYVTVSGVDIQPVPGEAAFWRAFPIVVNNGNTSTKNMWWTGVGNDVRGKLWLGWTISKPEGPLLQTFKDFLGATRNTMSLGPRQENHSLSLSQPIPVQEIIGIKNRTMKLYIHGAFFYQDFISPQGHVTRYCYTLWYNPAISGQSGIAYGECGGKTNCADEECEDYERLKTLAVPISK